ncbi:MAG TPA: carboxypeptidase-like regulatory domain-containing protein, partial [Bacteroidales bacterium]|nr:carboxypeptidase-like regulatory domain-containing protein [Bacteroidales bacterium]
MRKVTSLFTALLLSFMIIQSENANSQVIIGDGTVVGKSLPIEPFYGYTYSQVIYLASEIDAAGDITKLSWYFAGSSLSNSNDWTIYIGHTTKTQFESTIDWIDVTTLTQVYSGVFADPGVAGWIEFDITDFTYDGISNLVIAVDENKASYNGSADDFYCSNVVENRGLVYRNDYTNPDPLSPPTATYLYPNIANIILGGIQQACPNPTALTATNLTTTSADLGWTAGGTETMWNIEWGPQGFELGTVSGTFVSGVTVNPYPLTGLEASTSYDFYVQSDCGSGTLSSWAGPFTFFTTQIPAVLPFTEDFETLPNSWEIVNGAMVNQWHVGGATFYEGSQAAYISNDGGVSNAYTVTTSSVSHLYRDISFPTGASGFELKFWWKGQGEGVTTFFDYLRVFLVETSVIPTAGVQLTSGQIGDTYNLQADWQEVTLLLPQTLAGTTHRIVFSWRNDSSIGTQPPAAIDMIEISELQLGSLEGYVTEASKGPIENARVFSGDYEGFTDATGFYQIENVLEGMYDFTCEADGYFSETTTGVEIFPDATTTLDFELGYAQIAVDPEIIQETLQPGQITETQLTISN